MTVVERTTVYFTIKYRLASLIWYKDVLLARVVNEMSRRSQFSLHANGKTLRISSKRTIDREAV